MTEAVEIIIRQVGNKKSYWIHSPFGGYMKLPKSEAQAALANGAAEIHKTDPDVLRELREQIRESGDDD
jgi:hypothetical protein